MPERISSGEFFLLLVIYTFIRGCVETSISSYPYATYISRYTGEVVEANEAQVFAWQARCKGIDVHALAEPTKLEALKKEFNKEKSTTDNEQRKVSYSFTPCFLWNCAGLAYCEQSFYKSQVTLILELNCLWIQ